MKTHRRLSRRTVLKVCGAVGALIAFSPCKAQPALSATRSWHAPARPANTLKEILARVFSTPLVDTHEHLIEESERLKDVAPPRVPCDD